MVFKHETKVLKHRNLFEQRLGQVFKRLLFKHNGFCSNTFAFAFDVVVPGRPLTRYIHAYTLSSCSCHRPPGATHACLAH